MITIIVPLFKYVNRKFKTILNIHEFAKERKLFYLRHEEIGEKIIALDPKKRTLLYFKKNNKTSPSCLIVNLEDLDSCSIEKKYNSIDAGDLQKRKLQDYLKSIFLHLGFKNSSRIVSLPLYEVDNDKKDDVEQFEAKAHKWGKLVSRLLPAKEPVSLVIPICL